MNLHYLLFELIGPDGHKYEIYLDGYCKGFPDGTVINNCASPLFYHGIINLPCPLVPKDRDKPVPCRSFAGGGTECNGDVTCSRGKIGGHDVCFRIFSGKGNDVGCTPRGKEQ